MLMQQSWVVIVCVAILTTLTMKVQISVEVQIGSSKDCRSELISKPSTPSRSPMDTEHTNPETAAATEDIAKIAGHETLSLVMYHLELSRHTTQHLIKQKVTSMA